jgi:hypothetical protein
MFNFNFKLKLTPLWLFLILLAVLVIAVIFGVNSSNKEGLEGTLKFQKADAALVSVRVPWYQNTLYKLYENNFVDTLTGNIVRVYEDVSGYIGKFTVTDRSGVTTDYSTGSWTSTTPNAITNTVKPWSVSNPDNYAMPDITNTAIAYMPWGKDTYIRTFGEKNTTFFIGGCTDGQDNCLNKSLEHSDTDVSPTIEPVLTQVTDATQKSLITYITSKSKLADGVYYDLSGCVFVFNTSTVGGTGSGTLNVGGTESGTLNVGGTGSGTLNVVGSTTVNPPTMVSAKKDTSSSATITFTPPTDGVWPSSFVITSTPGSFITTVTAPAMKPATPVPMSGTVGPGLPSGIQYTFTVVSKKDSTTSIPSAASNSVKLIGLPEIGTITPQNSQNTIVNVPFTKPVGFALDDTYIATAKMKGTSTVVATSPPSKDSPLTISGLVNDTEYDITVETVEKKTEGFSSIFEGIGNMATVTVFKNRFTSDNVNYNSDPQDWRDTNDNCIKKGQQRLVTIKNPAENATITDILQTNKSETPTWIGGTAESGSRWRWIDDNAFSWINWLDGKDPGFGQNGRNRLAIQSDGKWVGQDVEKSRYPYLCTSNLEKFSVMEGMDGGALQIMMYKRDGSAGVPITKMSDINATIVNVTDFKPWSLKVSSTKSILVIPRKLNTFVAVINKDSDTTKNKYMIENPRMYTPSVMLTVAGADSVDPSATTVAGGKTDKSEDESEYWKKYWYWQTNGESSDYILKTQVIPPVCPACPGTCTSGGTSGGINSASSSSSAIKSVGTDITGVAKDAVAGGTGLAKDVVSGGVGVAKDVVSGGVGLAKDAASGGVGLAKDAASGGVGLAKDVASGGVGLAKDTVSGGIGLAKDVASGGVGLVKDTVSGGVGLVKDTVSGGVGLVKDTVSGGVGLVYDILPRGSGSGSGGGGSGSGGSGSVQNKNDVYTYNGALTNKASSNFMPVTASFSAFSR